MNKSLIEEKIHRIITERVGPRFPLRHGICMKELRKYYQQQITELRYGIIREVQINVLIKQ